MGADKKSKVTPEGMRVPVYRVVIEFDPTQGLNVDVPDDPIMALGLLEMGKAVVFQKLHVKQSPIVRV